MLFGLYVHFRNIAVSKFLYMGCKISFLRGNLLSKGLNSRSSALNKHYSDCKVINSMDGASFPTMFSRPCLRILGRLPLLSPRSRGRKPNKPQNWSSSVYLLSFNSGYSVSSLFAVSKENISSSAGLLYSPSWILRRHSPVRTRRSYPLPSTENRAL